MILLYLSLFWLVVQGEKCPPGYSMCSDACCCDGAEMFCGAPLSMFPQASTQLNSKVTKVQFEGSCPAIDIKLLQKLCPNVRQLIFTPLYACQDCLPENLPFAITGRCQGEVPSTEMKSTSTYPPVTSQSSKSIATSTIMEPISIWSTMTINVSSSLPPTKASVRKRTGQSIAGPVAGGILGPIFAVAVSVGVFFYRRRRRAQLEIARNEERLPPPSLAELEASEYRAWNMGQPSVDDYMCPQSSNAAAAAQEPSSLLPQEFEMKAIGSSALAGCEENFYDTIVDDDNLHRAQYI